MLSKLFGTNARVKILKQTLLHPDVEFSPKIIAKKLKVPVASIKREMENLKKFGLLTSINVKPESSVVAEGDGASQSEGKKTGKPKKQLAEKAYVINTEFVLYDEIKSLIMKSQILYEKDFIENIKKIGDLKMLIFAGFFVNDPDSSVDLFIVGKFNKTPLIKTIAELEEDLGREVNYTIMSEKEFKYRRDVTDVFLYGILEGKKMISVDTFSKK